MVTCDWQHGRTVITLQPNRSATWQQSKRFLYLVGGVTLAVGLFWAFFGAWMVLPFAGLEVAVLTYVMLRVSRSTYRMQVITVEEDNVQVEEGEYYPVRRWRFKRPDAHIDVVEASSPVDAIELSLVGSEQRLPLGAFLNQDDRLRLREHFKQAGLIVCSDKWWDSRH